MGNATTSMAQLASEGLPDDQMPVWQFCVGNTGPGTVPWFGYYDEVRVSNVALPLAELESVRRMVFHTGLE